MFKDLEIVYIRGYAFMTRINLKNYTNEIIDSYLDQVKTFYLDSSETITIEVLEEIALRFKKSRQNDEANTEIIFKNSKTHRSLKRVFDRALIQRFAHLFPDQSEALDRQITFSRRALDGFYVALDRMVGADQLTDYRNKTLSIVQSSIGEEQSEDFNWDFLYTDPETNELCDDILINIIPHFHNLEQRRQWMSRVIENNLKSGNKHDPDTNWKFGKAEFFELMKALYQDIYNKIKQGNNKQDYIQKYGQETVEALESFMNKVFNEKISA